MFPVMRLLLLLDTITEEDIMELLDELLKILLNDLNLKLVKCLIRSRRILNRISKNNYGF